MCINYFFGKDQEDTVPEGKIAIVGWELGHWPETNINLQIFEHICTGSKESPGPALKSRLEEI